MKELGTLRLRDMAHTPAEREDHAPKAINESDGPKYPWGLRLHLDDHELKKLEIELPDVGDQFRVVGSGCVKAVSSSDHGNGESRHVEIQLEKLLLVPVEKPSEGEEVVIRTA